MLETMGIYAMGVILIIAVLAKLISYVTVRRMVKAASEIQKSNHRFMKLIKAKFEHASMVSDRVNNVRAFVEKHLYEYRVLKIRLYTLRGFPEKAAWFIGIVGVANAAIFYQKEQLGEHTLLYIKWTSLFVLGILLVHFLLEEERRLAAAKNYIIEYLENVCVRRYEKLAEEVIEPEVVIPQMEEPKEREKTDQEIRIRAILEEFLA